MTNVGKNQPHFDIDLSIGKVGENSTEEAYNSLVSGKVEVKTDYRTNETGNWYVETWSYRQPDASDKVKSGINITESEWWVQSSTDGDVLIWVKTDRLKQEMREMNPRETHQPISNLHSKASIGRLVNVKEFLQRVGMLKRND
jgi:hypothetical protein